MNEPHRRHSLQRLDPRIHFALVCGARACPSIAVYDAMRINNQVEMAARAFIVNGGVVIDRASGEVRLSQIFQWYAQDIGARPFGLGDKRPLLEFIAAYPADEGDRDYVLQGKPTVRFQTYDWSLNN